MATDLTTFERRILATLDQRGPTHRQTLVLDLYPPDGKPCLSANQAAWSALIFGGWTRRLVKAGLVRAVTRDGGYYGHHEITAAGRARLRVEPEVPSRQEEQR